MESTKEQMHMMHTMCQNELNLLKNNLEKFIRESDRCQHLLNELSTTDGITNIFGLIVFDRYMTQVVNVLNMARKFNIHLQINNLHQTIINASANGCLDDENFVQTRLLKDFIEWRNSSLDKNVFHNGAGETFNAVGQLKMAESSSDASGNNKINDSSDINNNKSLVKYTNGESAFDILDNVNNLLDSLLPQKCLEHFQNNYEFNAYIVHIRDNKKLEFFICQMNDYKTLYDMSTNIDYKRISHESVPEDDVFFILEKRDKEALKDCLWRAVLVPNERKKEPKKLVYLLDFGEIVPLTEHCITYIAPLRFKDIPPLAIKCILVGIEDSSLNRIIKDHHECERVLHKNEFEKVKLRIVRQRDRTLQVIMLDTNTTCEITSTNNNYVQPTNPFLVADSFENDDGNSSTNSAALQLPRSLLNFSSPVKQPILNIDAKVGDVLQIIVSHVVSPISFYGIIQNDYHGDYKVFSWHDRQIFPLQKEMSHPPKLNDIVLSQYVKDDYWYRARVIDIDSKNNYYKVFYVDFGNTEVVPLSNLAKCSKEQLKDPLRAVLFHLSNLSIITNPKELNVSESYCMKNRLKTAVENMVVMILDQILNVEIVEHRHNNDLVIRLLDRQYFDIPKMLIDMGVAEEV